MDAADLGPKDALQGLRIGVSVSDSDDLSQLGLSNMHAEHAVAEIARAVLLAGGSLVYGGRIQPSGFTQFLLHEVKRYGRDAAALTLCLAAPEHEKLSWRELDEVYRDSGSRVRLVCLDEAGAPMTDVLSSKPRGPGVSDAATAPTAYSSLRRYMGTITDARVVVGGRLAKFAGAMPGIIEETIVAIENRRPVLAAAGFGGAAALVAQHLGIDDLSWAPAHFPRYPKDERVDRAVARLEEVASATRWVASATGLRDRELRQLSASHRGGEIAALVVAGLSRTRQ